MKRYILVVLYASFHTFLIHGGGCASKANEPVIIPFTPKKRHVIIPERSRTRRPTAILPLSSSTMVKVMQPTNNSCNTHYHGISIEVSPETK